MVENQYISVKEFAQRAGISVQAVYKGLNNRLNQYVKLVDNQKMLDIRALQEVYGIEIEQPIQPELTTDSTEDSTSETVVEVLLEQLKKELDVKNEQLREKDKQLKEKDNQIAALNTRLEESHRLLDQSQQLQAMAENKVKLLEQIQEKNNVVEPAPEKKKWWYFW